MKKFLFLSILLLCFINPAKSTHAVGGNFVIVQTAANTFNITCKVYRDCCPTCTAMPTLITVGIYYANNNVLYTSINMTNPTLSNIPLGDACYTPAGICLQEGVFTSNGVIIPDNAAGFYIQSELFARNNTIINLSNPGNTGMSFYAEIPNPAISGMNSSPDFGPYPSDGYFCVNSVKYLDFSVIDADGDSLVYSLVEPLADNLGANGTSPAPYSPVTWQPPYSFANIVGGVPAMICDPVTGVVTAAPSALGTFVFAIRIEEYRNSIKIGEVRRDVQYHSLNCSFDDYPEVLPDTLQVSMAGDGCFDILVLDGNLTDSVSIELTSLTFDDGATLGMPVPFQTSPDTLYQFSYFNEITGMNDTVLLAEPTYQNGFYSSIGGVGLRYCKALDCEDIEMGPFEIDVTAYSLGCSGIVYTLDQTISYTVTLPIGEAAFVANIFTPNKDGINDVYKLGGDGNICSDSISIQIFDRWGNLVFESDDADFEWDGKNTKGKDLTEGTYYVILNGIYGDEEVNRQYPLTLIREKN
jgi:gliding motility-associated-like protein